MRALALALGGGFYVSDWTRDHANFFRSIEITKSMLFVILLMLVAVAAFNIVATLVMIVKEKQTDIAILRTLGAGPGNILATFAVQGVLIGLAGYALRRGARYSGVAQPADTGWRFGARSAHAVFGRACVFHERAAGVCRGARRAAGMLGSLFAVRARDGVPGVARCAHDTRGGAAP